MEVTPPQAQINTPRPYHTVLGTFGIITAIFLTGFAGVSFQILIERLIKLVAGGTTASTTIVTYTTLAGMGLGSMIAVLPKVMSQTPYRVIARASSLYTLLTSVLALPILHYISGYSITHHIREPFSFMLIMIGAILIVLPSAMLSGAVIPRIMHFVAPGLLRSAGFLYGIYTIGSAAGIYALIRVFLPLTDFRVIFLIIAGIYLFVSVVFRILEPYHFAQTESTAKEKPVSVKRKYAAIQFISGITGVILEISIFRAIGVTWGGSSPYAFPFALLTYLVAYAAGSAIIAPVYKRAFPSLGLTPVFILLPIAFVSALYTSKTIPDQGLLSLFFVGAVEHVGAVAFLSGAFFPLLLSEGSLKHIERQSGILSMMSALGSLFGGLFLLLVGFPFLGTRITILITFTVYLTSVVAFLSRGKQQRVYGIAAVGLLALLVMVPQSRWNLWIQKTSNPNAQRIEGSGGVAVIDWENERRAAGSVIINGTLASYIPYLASHSFLSALSSGAPNRERVLILGLGGGGIVRDVLDMKHVRSVDVIEWSRELIALLYTHDASGVISDALKDPRVHVLPTDARTYASLATTLGKTYTLIIDNLIVLGWSGSTFIRSVEYFQSMLPLLTDDGTYVIMLHHNYQRQYDAAIAGLLQVCPFLASYDKTYVICSKQEVIWDTDYMDRVLMEYSNIPALRSALHPEPQWIYKNYVRLQKKDYTGVEPIRDSLPYFEYEEFAIWKKYPAN